MIVLSRFFRRNRNSGAFRSRLRHLFLAFLCLGGAFPAGAETPDADAALPAAAENFRRRLQEAAAAFDPAAPKPESVSGSTAAAAAVVRFGDADSSGNGFLCRLWGVPVILTNAHVFALQHDSEIKDSGGRVYPVRSALISTVRDLAVIETEIPPEQPLFELNGDLATLKHNAKATLFSGAGDHGETAKRNGKVLAIGPETLEVSCEFKPGDSGSPIVDQAFRVIAIATSISYSNEESWTNEGTRFSNNIRRFAIRSDKVAPDEFECFDPARQRQDLEAFNRLARASRAFLEAIPELNIPEVRTLFYETYSRLDVDWDYRPSISFLAGRYREEIEKILVWSALFGIPPVKPAPAEIRQADAMFQTLQRCRRDKFSCRKCGGQGKFGNLDNRKRCDDCRGVGETEVPYYSLHRSPISALVQFGPLRAGKIAPGMEPGMVFRLLEIRERDVDLIETSGVFQGAVVIPNPFFYDSTRTSLQFVAEKLSCIQVYFHCNRPLWQELEETLTRSCGKPQIRWGDGLSFEYLLFTRPGGSLTLSLLSFSNQRGVIRLMARHNALTELEFRLFRSLEGKLYTPRAEP